MTKFIGQDAFREALRAKRPATSGVFRVSTVPTKAATDGSRIIRFCFSDGSVDRMGDTIEPMGWDLAPFLANPVALWAHDSSQPPVGRAQNLAIEDQRLMGDIDFAPAEIYAFADTIYRLVLGKYINAVSVGFMPTEYEWANDDDREWGIDYKKQELMEISVVPIPANSNALAVARAKGIDTRSLVEWAEKTLDEGGKIIVPKSEIGQLRNAAKEPVRLRGAPKFVMIDGKQYSLAPEVRSGGGMTETDPASGGAVVATCGRAKEDECGLTNSAECAVHGEQDMDEKALAAAIQRAVAEGMKEALKAPAAPARRAPARPVRRDPEGGDGSDPSMDGDVARCIRMAHEHLKAADDFYEAGDDHHDKALDLLEEARKSIDGDDNGETLEGETPEGDANKERAAHARRLKELYGV